MTKIKAKHRFFAILMSLMMAVSMSGSAFAAEAAEDPATITVNASGDEKTITAVWSKCSDAAYYMVYLDSSSTGVKVSASSGTPRRQVFRSVSANSKHRVRVEAYRNTQSAGDTDEKHELFAQGSAENISAVSREKLTGKLKLKAKSLDQNLRKMLGEPNGGYAVAQGAASDGKYAYYMMASSGTQKGRVLKVDLSKPSDRKRGPIIKVHHANGFTYDSRRKLLVAIGYGAYRHQLTYIDPGTLKVVKQFDVTYQKSMDGYKYMCNGMAAIAYVEKYDVYVTRTRGDKNHNGNNDIMVFRPADSATAGKAPSKVNVVGYVRTKVCADYPETYQSMDADEKYVYFLLSPGRGQSNNVILALDWNSENLLPVINGDKKYVKEIWYCNNNGSGRPDAAIQIPISRESEGLFHTTDPNGSEHFYVSEYYGRWHYKTYYKTVKYKKKWKKARKWYNKKTKKWQKKKPAKKYRGRSKKVWLYKTKTKKVKVKKPDYWARDDYVYDLGVF